jgi:hypothetical protein
MAGLGVGQFGALKSAEGMGGELDCVHGVFFAMKEVDSVINKLTEINCDLVD